MSDGEDKKTRATICHPRQLAVSLSLHSLKVLRVSHRELTTLPYLYLTYKSYLSRLTFSRGSSQSPLGTANPHPDKLDLNSEEILAFDPLQKLIKSSQNQSKK